MHAFSSSIVQQGSKVFFLDCDHSFATRLSNLKTSCRNQPTGAPLKRRVHSSASDDDRGREVVSPMPPPPDLGGKDPRKYWNATALAFLGDSVWEVRLN